MDAWLGKLTGIGLERVADMVLPRARASLRLTESADGPHQSGGEPHLPPDVPWPSYNGTPLAFLAGLQLAHLPPIPSLPLPATGSLLFFYEAEEQPWGFDPAHRGCSQVVHVPDGHPRRPSPMTPFTHRRLMATPELTLPRLGWEEIERHAISTESFWAYEELRAGGENSRVHRIGGHPNEIQQPMELEAHLVTQGIHCGSAEGYEEGERRGLHAGAADWRLLLQLDSEDEAGMMWGDSGRLYFWIHKDDLAAHRFDNVWLILQCA